jgi:hypothetical protein
MVLGQIVNMGLHCYSANLNQAHNLSGEHKKSNAIIGVV